MTFRKLNLSFFVLLLALSLSACREGEVKDARLVEDKPYKATTVDECIDEQACFEYVFLREVIPNYDGMTDEDRTNYRFKRWKDNLRIKFIESENVSKDQINSFKKDFKEIADKFDDDIGKKIIFPKNEGVVNTLLIIAKDKNDAFIQLNKSESDLSFNSYFNVSEETIYRTIEGNSYVNGMILVTPRIIQDGCYLSLLSEYFGLNKSLSEEFKLSDYNRCEVDNLNGLVTTLYTVRQLPTGSNIDEIKNVMNRFYDLGKSTAESYGIKISELIHERQFAHENGMPIKR